MKRDVDFIGTPSPQGRPRFSCPSVRRIYLLPSPVSIPPLSSPYTPLPRTPNHAAGEAPAPSDQADHEHDRTHRRSVRRRGHQSAVRCPPHASNPARSWRWTATCKSQLWLRSAVPRHGLAQRV
ncbi:hypothetical protein SLEP1_g34795 [Rubroshorea leprosula]|uniref:Uncharacterized protein n=1 Tax=Rubroshorea leprosula TaxID=152421 RepID=A0AAV5KLE0_9ROSI|nr:hypothetical protein SLEP1_g34795 [Rubroshorea leprosula]